MVFIGPALPSKWESSGEVPEESLLEQQPSAGAIAHTEPELPQLQMQPPKPGWVGLGLGNMGNSCYLNSVLQCLTYCPPLGHLCRQDYHRMTTREHNWKNCAYCLLETRIKRSLEPREGLGGTRARTIYDNLDVFSKSLSRGEQEDAHEFLRLLLEAVESSCVKNSGQARPQPGKVRAAGWRKPAFEALAAHMVSKEATTQHHAGQEAYTIVQHIFGGKLQSQVSCLECGHSSNTYDSFCDLSLEITMCSHVEDALARFTAPENLDGPNAYSCERCKRLVSARKQITIQEAPNVLVIHLKRFGGAYGLKIGRHVDFSETLSLEGYLSSNSPDRGSPPASSSGRSPEIPPANYRLRGVVVHQGSSANSGHYYAYVDVGSSSRPPLWCELNDSYKRKVDSRTVLEDSSYLLFYVREGAKPPRKRALEGAADRTAAKRVCTGGQVRQESPRPDTPDVAESAHDNNSADSSATNAGSSRQGSHEDGAGSPVRNLNGAEVAGQGRAGAGSEPDAVVPDAQPSDAAAWVAPKCKVVAEPRPPPRPPNASKSGEESADMEVPDMGLGASSRAGSRGLLGESTANGSGDSPAPDWMVRGPGTKFLPARRHSPVTYGKRQLDAGRSQAKGYARVFGPNSLRPAARGPSQSPLGRPIQSSSARLEDPATPAFGSSAASIRGGYDPAETAPGVGAAHGMRSVGDPRSSRAEIAGLGSEGKARQAGAAPPGKAYTSSAGESAPVRKPAVIGGSGPTEMLSGEAAATSAADKESNKQGAGQAAHGLEQTAIKEELQRVKSNVHTNLRHSSWPSWLKNSLEKSHAKEPGKDAEHFREEVMKKLRPLVPAGIKSSAMECLRSICKS